MFFLDVCSQLRLLNTLDVTWPPFPLQADSSVTPARGRRALPPGLPRAFLNWLIKTPDLWRPLLAPAFVEFLSRPRFLSVYFKPSFPFPSPFLFAFLELCPFTLLSRIFNSMQLSFWPPFPFALFIHILISEVLLCLVLSRYKKAISPASGCCCLSPFLPSPPVHVALFPRP